ncbi:MAG: transcriptional regulator [Citrobacter freundii]|nr:MAG: transcriptional regulator [Citrobacter freundii]
MADKQRTNYNAIKVVLAQQGVTGKKLAEDLNVKPQRVSKWATNTSQPSIEFLFEIAGCLRVDVRTLITANDPRGDRPNLPIQLPGQQRKDQTG